MYIIDILTKINVKCNIQPRIVSTKRKVATMCGKGICACNPGVLTPEQLEKMMLNAENIILWKMHPLVQNCLRVYAEKRPECIECWDTDTPGWIPNKMSPAQMLLEKYRLKAEMFDLNFLTGASALDMWNGIAAGKLRGA